MVTVAPLTGLPAASSTSTVGGPETTKPAVVEPGSTIHTTWVAVPEVTLKLSVLVEVNGEVVETVTGPARTPVTVTLAVPPELVGPEKLTDPLPPEVKTTPAPPLVRVLPCASFNVAVATQVV